MLGNGAVIPGLTNAANDARPVAHWASDAVTRQAAGSVVPSRQNFAWTVVPCVLMRIHHFVPAPPDASRVPLPSVAVPVPPAATIRASAQFTPPAAVCVMRAA